MTPPKHRPTQQQPIENYGVIGDLHTIALVGRNGSIDFMAFPTFDSPTVFAALLDMDRGGRFCIAPTLDQLRERQLYLPDTNVLLTRFMAGEGMAEISDFMPVEEVGHAHNLVRQVKTIRGEVTFRVHCEPRFDYARARHSVTANEREVIFESEASGLALRLRTPVALKVEDGAAVGEFTLRAGEVACFVLEEAKPGQESPTAAEDYVAQALEQTILFWRRWQDRSTYRGRWREMVGRSALVLKLMVYKPYGSLVAAPTFGLPEELGGGRNWDYRYTWIRDASFTLYALIRLGYTEEAAEFMRFIEARCQELNEGSPLQIMYGIDGRHDLTETTLDHLRGYHQSAPVRIGNGAFDQLQLDIYGELMDSVYLYDKYGEPIHHDLWNNLVRLLDWLVDNWQRKCKGIWEVRGDEQHFLFSRLMCWVAVDRGIRLATKRSLPAPLGRWERVRTAIYHDIFSKFWDDERRTFVQHLGSGSVDAATLLMPLVKFISPTDPRWLSTLQAIEKDLVVDALVYRYNVGEAAHDGLDGGEGTFTMCSFWYAEAAARAGELDKARTVFEKMLGYANHLGLYSEMLGPHGEHLGNFPQAFTHLGLISAAFDLDRRLDRQRR